MTHSNRTVPVQATAAVLLVLLMGACSEPVAPNAVAPSSASGARVGASSPGATVVQGDFVLADTDAPALATTCPSAPFAGTGWAVVFGASKCLIVQPVWASSTYAQYALTDDIVLNMQLEKGRNGRITHTRLAGQDVIGEAGIWHTTDWVPVAQPVTPTKAGFTLHVHARNVAVWRTDSHLAGGNRVEMIGTVSIGDIIYPAQ